MSETMRPLVEEILTNEQVREMVSMSSYGNHDYDFNNYFSIYKGWFETWDGERHDGYIIMHVTRKPTDETANDFMPNYDHYEEWYFMEATKTLVGTTGYMNTYDVTYHKLLPITVRSENRFSNSDTDMGRFVNKIIANASKDKFGYYSKPMTVDEIIAAKRRMDWFAKNNGYTTLVPLTYAEIGSVTEPMSESEKTAKIADEKAKEESLIARFSDGELPPAEDDAWYAILANIDSAGFGDYTLERKVINILKNRGYSVRIDGEKDSFGWVTRGLVVDGEIKCMI